MRVADLKVGVKIVSGFVAIVLLFMVSGFYMYMEQQKMIVSSSIADASMEMKMAVRTDMQLLMDMLGAADEKELASAWSEHEQEVSTFDLYVGGILSGIETPDVTVHATSDPQVIALVQKADTFHNSEFQPRIKKVHDIVLKSFRLWMKGKLP